MAIVGSDNSEAGTFVEPQLTTIDLRVDDVAQAVIEVLFQLLDHDSVAGTVVRSF